MLATINSIATNIILASSGEAPKKTVDSSKVEATPLWADVVVPLAQGLGAFLVLAGIFKIVTQVMSGKAQGAFKTGALTIFGGAILFNLGLIFQIIAGGDTIVTKIIDSVTGLIG